MFTYDFSEILKKRLRKLAKKDRILALIFRKKHNEVISCNFQTVQKYKNLLSPQNEFKRIHLTKSHVLLFRVDIEKNHILFVDIVHWDKAYH